MENEHFVSFNSKVKYLKSAIMELFIWLTLSKVMNFKISRREKLIVSSTSTNLQFDLPVQLLSYPLSNFHRPIFKTNSPKRNFKIRIQTAASDAASISAEQFSLLNDIHIKI